MAEYIERETMIQAIREYSGFFQYSPSTNHMILKMEVEKVARDLEAADVAPVVHGRWEVDEFGRCCSACKEYIPDDFAPSEYCPNCGAKMDVKED